MWVLFFIHTDTVQIQKEYQMNVEKTGSTQFPLRIPTEVKEWVKRRAERADRSQNWVIVKILEQVKKEEEARQ
jgi:predicted HicB family RNase H-like nuclease